MCLGLAYTNSSLEDSELKVAHMHKNFGRSGWNRISTFKGQFNSGIGKQRKKKREFMSQQLGIVLYKVISSRVFCRTSLSVFYCYIKQDQ